MVLTVCTILAALFSEAVAFRARHRRAANPMHVEGAGASLGSSTSGALVDQLFVFGVPGVSEDGLTTKDGGCIPGMHVFSSRKWAFGLKRYLDFPVSLTQAFGFKQSKMDQIMFDTEDDELTEGHCPNEVEQNKPFLPSFTMHDRDIYVRHGHKVAHVVPQEVIYVAVQHSYERDLGAAKDAVEAKGWDLLGSALHNGSDTSGPQVSHLMQNRTSGSCMLTFQGSDSLEDAWALLDRTKVSFCGLPTLVHKGWRDNMLRITETSDWQDKIRAKLPSCSKVVVVGHSMGGGMASLFTACVLHGESEDFQTMNW